MIAGGLGRPGRLLASGPGRLRRAAGLLAVVGGLALAGHGAWIPAKAWLAQHGAALSRAVYSHVIELGGSISAEHGIGQMKRDILAELDSPARLHALRAVKAGLDPAGLFNPGKLIG